jgi:Overcoming lysogenization defect protein-like, TOPRIM domain
VTGVIPDAGPEATSRALERVGGARAVVLVEGFSDQIALETLAERRGRDLEREGVAIVPIGGAQALGRFVRRFGGLRVAGLCDAREEDVFLRGFARAGLERRDFHVCVEDLEDELIRALGTDAVEAVLEANGDLEPFRTFQKQPAWRGRRADAQLRRFMGSADRRKLRYARLLVEALDLDAMPPPLDGVLADL